ncbi:MAG: hypothetical protein R2909_21585 [Gemmatimonadales bacterium]
MRLRLRLLALALAVPAPLLAQGYRARIDARAQAVSYRGVQEDSVLASSVVTGAGGGLYSPDGFAVSCTGGQWCYFYRPGPERRGVPVSTTASLVAWGFGIQGLTLHALGRVVADAGDADVWPGSDPTVQLLEGYLEYTRSRFTGRAGRLLINSRLEPLGLDGGWARFRLPSLDLDLAAYGGWGLGQAAVVPVTSPVLNPLDEWRPGSRQLAAGAELAWAPGPAEVRAEYRREVDPETDYFVSERAALSLTATPWRSIRLAAGADYNLAEGNLGSADATISWIDPRWSVTVGGRRYRPFFNLWTLWGAFSPVPYNAVQASTQLRLTDWLSVRARGERFWYEDAEVSTPLVDVEDRGWRASVGASANPSSRLSVDVSWLGEYGPGAAARFIDASASYAVSSNLSLSVYGGSLARPLELRYYDAEANWIGGRAEWRTAAQWRLWADASWFDEKRKRPDAAASSLDQLRIRSGLSLSFGTNADRPALPPARRRIP